MPDSSIILVYFFIVAAFVWVVPIISILMSKRTHGAEKLGWILAVIFISWFAWILYLIVAPVQKRR